MATHQQFLDAIATAPEAIAARLMYADWLEERGSPLCHEWRQAIVRITTLTVECDHNGGNRFSRGDGWCNRYGRGDGSGDGMSEDGLFGDGFEFGDGDGDGIYYE